MPATESTWRNISRMHVIFAVTGVLLMIATVWMFQADYSRSWKTYQANVVNVDLKMNEWRQEQFDTDQAVSAHRELTAGVRLAMAQPLDPNLLARFKDDVAKVEQLDFTNLSFSLDEINDGAAELEALARTAGEKRQAANEAAAAAAATPDDAEAKEKAEAADQEAQQAESSAGQKRSEIIEHLQRIVDRVKKDEDEKLRQRKFKSGELDAARANLDIAVRDNVDPSRAKKAIDELKGELDVLNTQYQSISGLRKDMEIVVREINANVADAEKSLEDSLAALERLRTAQDKSEETWFSDKPPFFLGKKFLNLPILDAFMSPRRPDNLWAEGLEQNYNFRNVRRFDRCTTCHGSMQKTLPGEPTTPAYVAEQRFDVIIPALEEIPAVELDENENPKPASVEKLLGLRLAGEGLLSRDDVTVSLVQPQSPGARAQIVTPEGQSQEKLAEDIRGQFASLTGPRLTETPDYPTIPGLLVGDVIVAINGSDVFGQYRGAARVGAALADLAQAGQPIRLTVRRGLPNPYNSHPRLDLFVGDSSPHAMGKFACTICHDGQGSSTSFEWASHTPNSLIQMEQWSHDHGWFDNPHWIYPMYPQRFAESSCLKCHHDVVELEPSDRFPDAPAPKLVHGYHLIRKFGCYGCHEINGFDGPTRRIGPDMRLEPNYFAIGQEMLVPERLPRLVANVENQRAELEKSIAEESRRLADETARRDELQKERDELQNSDNPDKEEATKRLDEQLATLGTTIDELSAKVAPVREQIVALNSQANQLDQIVKLAERIVGLPEDGDARRTLRGLIEADAQLPSESQLLSPIIHGYAHALRDLEAPGDMRKPGPSLRYMTSKLNNDQWLYDWINNPQNFRPGTRMPRFFGLWSHLQEPEDRESLEKAQRLEPIEIRGTMQYLKDYSQEFEPLAKPESIDEWTNEEQVARGKIQFETRGCLACHSHKDFPDVEKYRRPNEIVQGPDLSGVGVKFNPERNPKGPSWLYSWIKEPTKYHARTVMPNLFLDPEKDAEGKTFDPVDDIVAYLLSESETDWQPVKQSADETLTADQQSALKELTLEYLNETFYESAAQDYYDKGIEPAMRAELKGAEVELIVEPGQSLTDEQRLRYIGRRTLNKYGCFGCHDIPGFEDSKPIGTALADWGRKDPSKLAFEHISHYLEHHGHGTHAGHAGHDEGQADETSHDEEDVRPRPEGAETGNGEQIASEAHAPAEDRQTSAYYHHQIEAGSRIGFLWQKLKEPRSYDYKKTASPKRYNERLRMPQFPFTAEEREAVATFVLGLVAEPPNERYVYQPDERMSAILAGRQVLDKFNCAGCHILDGDRLTLTFSQDDFGPQSVGDLYPFLRPDFLPKNLEASAQADRRGLYHATIQGLPALAKDGYPRIVDFEGIPLEEGEVYDASQVGYGVDLMLPTVMAGNPYLPGQSPLIAWNRQIDKHHPSHGGVLTKYLLPRVTAIESEVNPNANGAEAYSWLPPPLMGEGLKVQPGWLHDFLLEPYLIRPATFLRMPKFNMSHEEAAQLVNYFAAFDNADYPYEASDTTNESTLALKDNQYRQSLEQAGAKPVARFDDAMRIVVDNNFCVKCHQVGDFEPQGSPRAKAPDLANVYRRLRPQYVRDWIANPKMILPYTPMPVNIPYKPADPHLGGVSQELYHGTSIEQIDALVDLLMNYDKYTRRQTRISDLIKPATGSEAQPTAETSTEVTTEGAR